MAGNSAGGEPSNAPQPDRWYTLRLGSSFKDDHPSSKFCTLRYEFKPASIDKSQPGSLHKNKDNRITVEFHNNQPGKPKVTFEGSSEDCKDNDGVLFFDGETFRLERLHRAVKRLRHVRQPGESAAGSAASAAVNSTTSVAMGTDSRSPPLGKMARAQPLSKSMVHSVPLEVERIDVGEPDSPVSKLVGKSTDKENICVPPIPSQASPDRSIEEENVDIDVDDDKTLLGSSFVDEQVSAPVFDINPPKQNDTDDEIADVGGSDDDERDKGPNDAAALRTKVNAEEQQTSSSSESSGSGSSGSGSGSGSSSSDSEGSDDDSASSGGDIDID